ncbi:MAG: adenylate/guanylate cyclase domain-containing protein [Gammaproteobacteria bacterium]
MSNNDNQQLFTKKIRNKYLLWVLMITFTIFILLGTGVFFFTYDLFLQEMTEKSEAKVELAATKVDKWLESKLSFLQIIGATISENPDAVVSESLIKEVMKKYDALSIYMGFSNGTFVDGSGWTPPEAYDPRQKDWYLQAVLSKAPVFTSPYRDEASSKIVVTIAYPVYDQGGLIGVLAMDIVIENIDSIINNFTLNELNNVHLVAGNGGFIAGENNQREIKSNIKDTPDREAFLQAVNSKKNLNVFNLDDYIVIARVSIADWYLVFHLPPSVILHPLHKLIGFFIVGLVVTLVVLGLALILISSVLAKPILQLVIGAKNISAGQYDQYMEIESRDELGYLTYSFNEMARGLKEREVIRSAFGKYVPHEIVTELLLGNKLLGGDKKEITILFCDIRGFTSLSENKDPSLVVVYLNSFFTNMETIITEHHGHINKYLGDGFLALFGAPEPLQNSAKQAVDAAHKILLRLEEFNQEHMSQTKIGIGIHTGEALIGNIGSENRTEYTAIGDAVNLTSRIESLCKYYDESLLVSEQTVAKLESDYVYRIIDNTLVKGRETSVVIYRTYGLHDLSVQQKTEIEIANQAVQAYLEGDFHSALTLINDHFKQPPLYLSLIIETISNSVMNAVPVDANV